MEDDEMNDLEFINEKVDKNEAKKLLLQVSITSNIYIMTSSTYYSITIFLFYYPKSRHIS